ncbi:hypothetical protein BC830DRAFT_681217 [Chytriomyces sp. MP71]|nr:hypothetical protein BC830DRAFT_759323 [Chytriomyces sp. MP71]KAI8611173.1 hypothetical protein BC830DRAFT_681217 [Chytriomyces sp. MP71]
MVLRNPVGTATGRNSFPSTFMSSSELPSSLSDPVNALFSSACKCMRVTWMHASILSSKPVWPFHHSGSLATSTPSGMIPFSATAPLSTRSNSTIPPATPSKNNSSSPPQPTNSTRSTDGHRSSTMRTASTAQAPRHISNRTTRNPSNTLNPGGTLLCVPFLHHPFVTSNSPPATLAASTKSFERTSKSARLARRILSISQPPHRTSLPRKTNPRKPRNAFATSPIPVSSTSHACSTSTRSAGAGCSRNHHARLTRTSVRCSMRECARKDHVRRYRCQGV